MITRKHTTCRKSLKSSRVKLVRPSRDPKVIRAARLLADEIRKIVQSVTADQAIEKTHAWNPRKQMFEPEHIRIAWNVLQQKSWLPKVS